MDFYQDRYIKFNNKASSDLFLISGREDTLLNKTVATQSTAHTQGVNVESVKYDSKVIKLSILFTTEMLKVNDIRSIYDLKRLIANYFDSDEAVELWDSKDPTVMCYALYQGASELKFLGNKTAITTVELLVPDGLYYSVVENKYTASLNSDGVLEANIKSNGTANSQVRYEVTMNSDNGYLGIVSAQGAMDYGNRNEADGTTAEMSVLMTNNKKGDFSNWTDATNFAENPTKKAVVAMGSDTQFGGRLGLLTTGFTNTTNSAYFGAIKEYTLSETASNWYLWAQAWFETGLMGQTGMWTLTVVDKNNKEIASMHIYKNDTTGNTARIRFVANGRNLKDFTFVPYYWQGNPYGSESRIAGRNPFDIKKEGSTIRFFWYGQYFTYTVPEIASMEAQKIQFFVGQYKGRNASKQLVTRMSLNNLSFTKTKVQYWKDVPNRYKKGDILLLDSSTRIPILNQMPCFQDQLKGTEYFPIVYGDNKIQFDYSSFATAPSINIFVREAYI